MFKPFRTAAVLGAGVMGAQIAAHLANAGLTVHLLDLAAETGDKNAIVEAAFKKLLKLNPPAFFSQKMSSRVILGNFDEHFERIKEVDWVIEAIVENLAIKQQLMERLERTVGDDTVISTNTSGLPIHAIVEGRSNDFRTRFLGTHFFNPPRYLKLLELIPTPETEEYVLERLQWFGRLYLGKGTVIAKDTPNFIANRIGVYGLMLGLRAFTEKGYSIEEIDTLTGTLVGRPKSATFRTADLVGLDTLLHVAGNLYPAIADDESRDVFCVPDLLHQLVETGSLGAKASQGFYKKVGAEILSLNPSTLKYEPARPLKLGEIENISKIADLTQRLCALYGVSGRGGDFFRQSTLNLLGYSARRLPEIAHSPLEVDRAMRWGFGWELGPFQIWDVLGFATVLDDMRAAGIAIADWVVAMEQQGLTGFYRGATTADSSADSSQNAGLEPSLSHQQKVYFPRQEYRAVPVPPEEISLSVVKADPNRTLWQNEEAALLDLGDGVVLYEFRSKANTLSLKVVEGLTDVLNGLETDHFRGMVIGNEGTNFSVGVNLAEMGKLAQQGRFNPFVHKNGAIAALIDQFQTLLQRIHYFPKPIVAALQGRVLGGGCELAMACPQVVAAAESYIGLVELGVGLIPAGGGTMRMVARSAERAASDSPDRIQPFLQQAFETIGMAKVSNSAYEAQELGFLSSTARITMDADRRLFIAKEEVLRLAREGYIPLPERNSIRVLGRPAQAILDHAAYVMCEGGFISEYDRHLANRLAYIMTGGDLSAPALVSEDYLLRLERETFLPLLDQKKTQDRIVHLLKTKKPLRN